MSVRQIWLRSSSNRAFGAFAVLMSGITVIGAGLTFLITPPNRSPNDVILAQAAQQTEFELELRLASQQIQTLQRTLAAMQNGDRGGSPDVRGLAVRIQSIEQHQHELERIIMQDPEKALQMPLFQRDLQNLRDSNARDLTSVRADVDRVYSLSQWLIGGMALSVFALALNSLRPRKSDPEKS